MGPLDYQLPRKNKSTIRDCRPGWCSWESNAGSGLLRLRPEVVVERHLAAHDGILLPLRHALGELELRVEDLLEQRVLARLLLHDLVVDLELLLQDRVRGLVE